jgi:LCP family protein required for cell wall assembly
MLAWYQDYKKRDIERKKEERRFRILKKIMMMLLGVLVVLLIIAGVVKTLVSAHILTIGNVFSVAGKELPVDENGFTNILLMGRGDRTHDGVDLTDSMMIVSIDAKKTRSVVMVSLPRDLYVLDPITLTKGRINTLYRDAKAVIKQKEDLTDAEASPKALDAVIKEIGAQFGMTIHRAVMVNFSAFTELVDAVGGLDIVVPEDLVDPEYPNETENGYELFVLRAGPQHLDGKTALKYVRSRHSTSDFARSARQQQVLHELSEKMRETGWIRNPSKLLELWHIVSNNTETSMDLGEMLGLAGLGERVKRDNVISVQLSDRSGYGGFLGEPGGLLYSPPRDQFGGASVLLPISYPEFPVTYKQVQAFMKFLMTYRGLLLTHPDIAVYNAGAKPGMAGMLAGELSRFDLPVNTVGNSPTKEKLETSVIRARSSAEKPLADAIGKILRLPVEVAEQVSISSDGTVLTNSEGEAMEPPAQVTIVLGKDYEFTPLQGLLSDL